jgi:hypothetical protein
MKCTRLFIILAAASVAGCGSGSDPTIGRTDKIEGPAIKSLSHEQLMEVVHECHRYRSSDDPKVKYTIGYCSAAQTAHAMEGYSNASSAAVNPSIDKLH